MSNTIHMRFVNDGKIIKYGEVCLLGGYVNVYHGNIDNCGRTGFVWETVEVTS